MSVNIDLEFTITNFSPGKRDALVKAASDFLLLDQGLDAFGLRVDVVEGGSKIRGKTAWPAIISRSYIWLPEVEKTWAELAETINEGPCDAQVFANYADEDC